MHKAKVNLQFSYRFNRTQNADVATGVIVKHIDSCNTDWNRLVFIFKPLLGVNVDYLPP